MHLISIRIIRTIRRFLHRKLYYDHRLQYARQGNVVESSRSNARWSLRPINSQWLKTLICRNGYVPPSGFRLGIAIAFTNYTTRPVFYSLVSTNVLASKQSIFTEFLISIMTFPPHFCLHRRGCSPNPDACFWNCRSLIIGQYSHFGNSDVTVIST